MKSKNKDFDIPKTGVYELSDLIIKLEQKFNPY